MMKKKSSRQQVSTLDCADGKDGSLNHFRLFDSKKKHHCCNFLLSMRQILQFEYSESLLTIGAAYTRRILVPR